jgi:hypothetical protein
MVNLLLANVETLIRDISKVLLLVAKMKSAFATLSTSWIMRAIRISIQQAIHNDLYQLCDRSYDQGTYRSINPATPTIDSERCRNCHELFYTFCRWLIATLSRSIEKALEPRHAGLVGPHLTSSALFDHRPRASDPFYVILLSNPFVLYCFLIHSRVWAMWRDLRAY